MRIILCFNLWWSTWVAASQVDYNSNKTMEAVPEVYSYPYLRYNQVQDHPADLHVDQSVSSERERRDHEHTESITITVEDHLVRGLKEVIDQYMKEMQNQPSSAASNHPDYYHYDEGAVDIESLFGQFVSSGDTRINTPFQCLWKRCSLGLFSTSGQDLVEWGKELIMIVVIFNIYWLCSGN